MPSSIRVLMPNGHVVEMKLETYLAGVVASEMGANAPLEALKAQAGRGAHVRGVGASPSRGRMRTCVPSRIARSGAASIRSWRPRCFAR